MSWKIRDLMKSRIQFIEDHAKGDLGLAEVCRRHGISRKTAYKWLRRHASEGVMGLVDRSRKPLGSPFRSSLAIEAKVIAIRGEHPAWGGRKIRQILISEGIGKSEAPAPSTITNILRRHGLLGDGMRSGADAIIRFERNEPNDLWQMDFKGHFAMDGGARCHPLTVLDDHSRCNLVLGACLNESRIAVQPLLEQAFRRYGLPRQILCDHGSPWCGGGGVTGLEIWLNRLGVRLIHGRVRHPQTQGKEERFHRTLNVEVIRRETLWLDIAHCQREFDRWQAVYNHKRPHEALDMLTPWSAYSISARTFPEELPMAESFYLSGDELRKVNAKGEIGFGNRRYSLGQGYGREVVAMRATDENSWDVYHCWKRLGAIRTNGAKPPRGTCMNLENEDE